jgi:hypothetical protein
MAGDRAQPREAETWRSCGAPTSNGERWIGAFAVLALGGALAACSTSGSCRDHGDCDATQRCLDGVCRSNGEPCSRPAGGCSATLSPDQCLAAGGTVGGQEAKFCQCPASDDGCPCWAPEHCSGACMGDPRTCSSTKVGTCRHFPGGRPMGCGCFLMDTGFQTICAN